VGLERKSHIYAGKVLYVTVSSVFWAAGDGAGSLAANTGFEVGRGAAGMDVDGLGAGLFSKSGLVLL